VRCVVQRVSSAVVTVDGQAVGGIGRGLVILAGVETGDTAADAVYMAGKISRLRIFADDDGKMNLSVLNMGGEVLAVSQFTLLGDARGQNRPGFTRAEAPETANTLYIALCDALRGMGIRVATGRFGAHMVLSLANDGPVTILLDSRKLF
jgi:D-aminoacyl-tRNA deacylase